MTSQAIVFTRTKRGADQVNKHLTEAGIQSTAIHGNKSQSQRERSLAGFKSGNQKVLVATDIAARGIDIDGVSHVVNFELPNVPESYVHRIGRTARAGRSGTAISLCEPAERKLLKDIEKLIGKALKAEPGQPQGSTAEKVETKTNRRPAQFSKVGAPENKRKPKNSRRRAKSNKALNNHAQRLTTSSGTDQSMDGLVRMLGKVDTAKTNSSAHRG